MTLSDQIKIVVGPSRDRLFDACKYRFDPNSQILTVFLDDQEISYEVQIDSLEHEDGSGNNFNFAVRLVRRFHKGRELDSSDMGPYIRLRGNYNTKRRTGSMRFVHN